jgi:hypothetical protein
MAIHYFDQLDRETLDIRSNGLGRIESYLRNGARAKHITQEMHTAYAGAHINALLHNYASREARKKDQTLLESVQGDPEGSAILSKVHGDFLYNAEHFPDGERVRVHSDISTLLGDVLEKAGVSNEQFETIDPNRSWSECIHALTPMYYTWDLSNSEIEDPEEARQVYFDLVLKRYRQHLEIQAEWIDRLSQKLDPNVAERLNSLVRASSIDATIFQTQRIFSQLMLGIDVQELKYDPLPKMDNDGKGEAAA